MVEVAEIIIHEIHEADEPNVLARLFDADAFAERNRRMDEDGYLDLITTEAFCREKADELLSQRGLKVDAPSRQKIETAFGAAIQRASLTLAKLAIGQLEALMGSPASPTHSEVESQDAICSDCNGLPHLLRGQPFSVGHKLLLHLADERHGTAEPKQPQPQEIQRHIDADDVCRVRFDAAACRLASK